MLLADVAPPLTVFQSILAYVVAPLLPLLVGGLLGLIGKLLIYLHAKEQESKTAKVFATITEAAKSVVAELEVEVRPELQKALADGRLSPEEGEQLKKMALERLKGSLPPMLLRSASELFGGLLDAWLGGLVERANAGQKVDTAAPQG